MPPFHPASKRPMMIRDYEALLLLAKSNAKDVALGEFSRIGKRGPSGRACFVSESEPLSVCVAMRSAQQALGWGS